MFCCFCVGVRELSNHFTSLFLPWRLSTKMNWMDMGKEREMASYGDGLEV